MMPIALMKRMMNKIPLKKRYFTIGEVCELAKIKHTQLRYWEKKTKLITPNRVSHNRRTYSRQDVSRVLLLSKLIIEEGKSIKDALTIIESSPDSTTQLLSVMSEINSILSE